MNFFTCDVQYESAIALVFDFRENITIGDILLQAVCVLRYA